MDYMLGNRYKDEEGFIWKVFRSEDGCIKIRCEDLMAEEPCFPRLAHCTKIA